MKSAAQLDDLILAIDQGTSAAKVVLLDLTGRVVASAGGETLVRYPRPTWMESDAESWWDVVSAGIREVLATPGVSADRVRAIGICGFMHTLVPVDAQGRALYPPMLWPDQRAAAVVEELRAHSDLFTRLVGRPTTSMLAPGRLAWLNATHPEVLSSARSFLLSKDFIRFRLTGRFATDYYDAGGTGMYTGGTGLGRRQGGQWAGEILELVGVDPAKMPPILRPDEVAGEVTRAASEETGLRPGTPVITGSGDWFTTIVGSGCYLPDRTCFYLGTAGILGAFASAEEYDKIGQTHYFGSVTATGSALRWIRDVFCEPLGDSGGLVGAESYERLCDEAARSEPGARGLLFLPHLMGERGGGMRPHARGALFGLTLAHRRADVLRAVLEGTAFWLRATTEPQIRATDPGALVAFGGGARSALWRGIFAAVFGRPLLVPEVVEGGSLGAAMFAAVGTGLRRSYGELGAEWVRIVGVDSPDPRLQATYEALYADFLRLEETLSPLYVAPASPLGPNGTG
jgi:xylulokinase